MVMEYVSKGSLSDVLKKEGKTIEFKDQMDMYNFFQVEKNNQVENNIQAEKIIINIL
jgi:hypothetical protein